MQTADLQAANLSKQQERYWRWLQASQRYGTQGRFLLQGKFELDRFQQALQQSAQRYEILRTTFSVMPGMELPMQVLGHDIAPSCQLINLQSLTASVQQSMLAQQWEDLLQFSFDLEHGPLLYALLFRLSEEQHVLLLRMSALCADVSTLKYFSEEVLRLYNMRQPDKFLQDDEDILQYIDVTSWQNDLFTSEGASEQQAFWETYASSQINAVHIPFRSRQGSLLATHNQLASSVSTFQQVSTTLETIYQQRLQELSQRYAVTLETCLLTCWQILLWRLTGESPLIGVACDGRPYEELATALGPYTHMLPFMLSLNRKISFEQALAETSLAMQEMNEKQLYFRWEKLARERSPEEHIFPLSFVYTSWAEQWQQGPLVAGLQQLESQGEPSHLQLHVTQIGPQVQLQIRYQPSTLSPLDAQHLLGLYHTLLQSAIATPQAQVSALALLTPEEQEDQHKRWRGPQVAWPFVPLHHHFQAQAERQPQAPALCYDTHQLTYQQLDHLSNQLAHLLLARGLAPSDPIALYLPRNHWAIISLLAVLKAGGCYVPLDEDLPVARLRLLLDDLHPSIVLSHQPLYQHIGPSQVPVLLLEDLPGLLAPLPVTPPPIQVTPQQLAYIIYTSGSTGTPKGVLISHQSVSNYIHGICDLLQPKAGWHFATISSLAADLGNTSIFSALSSGGCLHVLPYSIITDGTAFARYVEHSPLDVLKIVPSHLQALLDTGTANILPRHHLILGGEALPWSLVEQLQQMDASCHLYNHYGPTEATIGALVHPLGPLNRLSLPPRATCGYSIPLGRPLPNVQLCLLDAHQHPVPAGVIGELYLAGTGLAAGYLNAPERTQERFLTGLPTREKTRWYRTGDLVRENEQGQLEFVGRQDRQVKVRGHRVELSEIEAHLRNHPGVREAVVQLWQGELAAYLVAWKLPGPNPHEVREALLQELPAALVPSHFVVLEQLPLTANGKVDLQNLPAPQLTTDSEQPILSEPGRTPIEEILLLIWQKILGVPHINREDDFFLLGGHSLLGTRVIAELRTVFGVEAPITWLFDAPTVAGLAERIEEALRQGNTREAPALVPAPRDQPLPLSFAQQRLWFLDQLEPGNTAYTVPTALWLRGPLSPHALEQSLLAIVHRHEVLRTTIEQHEGRPVQVLHHSDLVPLIRIDLTNLPVSERSQQAAFLASQEAARPFDLQHGPLLRIHLLHCSQQEYALLLTMHHAISDAWSRAIWLQELRTLYMGFVSGSPAPLPALPLQYADYAVWQRSWLQGEVLEQQLNYWKRQLAGLSSLNLPTDHPRPALQSFRGATHSLVLPGTLNTALKQLSQKNGTTLFMTLLAAFQVLLARSSGQEDIAVGTPIANRSRKEVEGLIGFFSNTLVLRNDLSGDPTFLELLARVRRVCLDAYTHQEVPFEQVVEAVQPRRDLSRSPLFQVLFQLQHATSSGEELADLHLAPFAQEGLTAKFDLTLALFDSGDSLLSTLEYNRDLFDAETIQHWLERWQVLLESLVSDPGLPISRYALLPAHERERLLEWNATRKEFTNHHLCLHELFEAQAARTPDAIAVMSEGVHLSYAALNRLATQLALFLQQRGVGPETIVGVCLERSIEQVVHLLAVLKAGGAYLPLDTEYPHERLAFYLTDARADILLTSERFHELFADLPINMFSLEDYWSDLSTECLPALESQVSSANLAYIIYTSGSTGIPKGVMISHHAITNHMHWMQETFSFSATDRVLQKTPFSFDASVWEFYAPLLTGASLVLARPGTHGDSAYLVQTMIREQITVIQVVPTLLHTLLDEPAIATCHSLDYLFCGGEELGPELLARAFTTLPTHTRLCNLYGPTECTIDTTFWVCEQASQLSRVPIGRPISNTQVYLLDSHLQPVPIGVAGEVYIGGAALAQGYRQRTDLTAEAFVPHPFSQEAGARLYKTGDLARFVPGKAGVLDYLGRSDGQVKLRGYRIELGEIEAVIGAHPAVSAVAVGIQQRAELTDQRLVAFVVCSPDQTLSLSELRRFAGERLPSYMLPNALLILDHLPLTPSGKTNRRELSTLIVPEEQEHQEEGLEPRNELEELVSQTWKLVLQREHLGREDNFFEVGGHSLLATQVVSRLRRLVGVELPVRALFEAPTIAQLATRLTQQLQSDQGLALPEIVPVSRDQELPLSFTQQRLWFLNQLEPDSTAYSAPVAVRLNGQLDQAALARALSTMIKRHEILRTTFPEKDGQAQQLIAPEPLTQLIILDLSHLSQEEREYIARQLAEQEAQQPFDLAQGPLLRCRLLQLVEQEDHMLLLTLHHIITDGWSMGILVRELTSLYTAFSQGEIPSLPALPIQYADYALWQRSWLQGAALQQQLDYWKQQLAGLIPLELPIDHPRPPIQTFRGASLHFQLPNTLYQQLHRLSQREGVTLFMTLLASFQVLLARYSGQEDIAVGTTIANRNHEEIEELIGCFINMLVLRCDLSDNPSFVDLLAQVRKVALQAYSHQDLPFEQVVEALQPQRDLSRSPLFQVLFVMQNLPDVSETSEAQAPMLAEALTFEQRVAKLELSLMVVERGQRLNIELGYNTDLFETSTIQRLLAHWQTLLEGIVAHPEQRLSLLPLLTPDEHNQMLLQLNAPQVHAPEYLCLHELFEVQVELTPHAVALVQGEEQLTYLALNQRANQLAHTLQRLGVGPEKRVCICLERSPELVIGMLAILKAGGAYVPLDPTLPKTRLTRLLQKVESPLLLTNETLLLQLPPTSAKVVFVDQELVTLSTEATENLQIRVTPENLAYIVSTSGSTGQPKSILIAHRGVTNYLNYLAQTYQINESFVVLQLPSVTFDASVRDIFGTLTNGGRLILLQPDEFKEPAAILGQIERQQVTAILSIVPSLLRVLVDTAQEMRETYSSLQLILASGEPLFVADCQRVANVMSQTTRIINQYGPTECTMTSTYYTLDPTWHEREALLAGKPIPGMQAYILDHSLNLVPPGVQGEVYLGGKGVARGYLNQAATTAERFLPDPWSTTPGARLYRTGDIARYSLDGNIELLGRNDQQVKIRGNRVELGEIEAALSWHPLVKQSVTLMREAENQEQQIVAYVVMEEEETIAATRTELRSFLKERLPDYMIPAHFVLLDSLPLTPNGKVDRRTLASLELTIEPSRFVIFRDAVEYHLCDIWSELLNKRPISVFDNFFDLGGHSILAVRLIAHIKRVFNRDLSLSALFQHQTVAELAILLRTQLPHEEDAAVLVPFQTYGDHIPFFCVHPAGGEVFEYRNLSRYIGTEQPFYGIRMPDPRKHYDEFRTLEGIAAHYIAALREVQPQGPYQIGGWSAGGQIAYEMAQQLQRQGQEVRLLAMIDSKPPKTDAQKQLAAESDTEIGADDASITKYLLKRYQLTLPQELTSQGEPATQLAYVYEQLKHLDIAPRDITLDQIRFFAHVQKTIERAIGCYLPEPYTGPITLFRAKDEELRSINTRLHEWQKLATHIDVHLVPGNHTSMIEEPYVKDLATALAHCLLPEHHL